jgi:CHAT domain-containing protein
MAERKYFLLFFFLLHFLRLPAQSVWSSDEIKANYDKANAFFNSKDPSAAKDSMALAIFGKVAGQLEGMQTGGLLLFHSLVESGVLLDVKGRYGEALEAYTKACRCFGRHPEWSDSMLFQVYVYAGPDYYYLEKFDSAYFILNAAERLIPEYPGLHEQERLYNALGALYYESGNYLEGKNYFYRALEIIQRQRPKDKTSAIDYENNIASCLYKLGSYQPSLDMYRKLMQYGNISSQICLNMGKSYMGLNDYGHALEYYREVRPEEVPGVYNEIAYTQFLLGKQDSALFYLDKWQGSVDKMHQSKIDDGINELYRAQVLMSGNKFRLAIGCLQNAVITFSGTFNNHDLMTNPGDFTGSFASYRLFDALSYKADALEKLFRQGRVEEYLMAARSAYNSAILLFRYIEKNYTTDDAKLFLKKNNQHLYQNAFLVCLELNRLHPGGPFLEEAFQTAEKSKASIVSQSVDDIISRHMPGIDPQLVQRERTIKYNIARLELKADPEQLTPVTSAILRQKSDYEIELAMVQKSMELNSRYYQLKYRDSCPGVKELQNRLNGDQALISLFVAGNGLHVFLLTSSSFDYAFIDSLPLLTGDVREWLRMLNSGETGRRFGDRTLEANLYRRLVQPILAKTDGKDQWIIIPDDIFDLLPFESLPVDDQHHYLIGRAAISYELSSRFLTDTDKRPLADQYSVLSFAPFAGQGALVNMHSLHLMARLPGSRSEIAGLPGKQFIDRQATKQQFLQEMNHYPVIHLCTHAISDPQNSQGSLIAFYPQQKGPEEDCLFLSELYGLNMDSIELVILSACESGKGEIVSNEGMISLSRGFLYAGCPGTLNSLWKADDQSTAAILQKFHVYLEKGYSKSAALQQAKLDYINSNGLYTTPDFWAHLVLIGNADAIVKDKTKDNLKGTILFFSILLLCVLILFIWYAGSAYRRRSYS